MIYLFINKMMNKKKVNDEKEQKKEEKGEENNKLFIALLSLFLRGRS